MKLGIVMVLPQGHAIGYFGPKISNLGNPKYLKKLQVRK